MSKEHNRIVLFYIIVELVFFISFLKSAFYLSVPYYFAFVLLPFSRSVGNFAFLILEEISLIRCPRIFFIQCT